MRLFRHMLAAATVLLCPFVALADTTYTYTGQDFTDVSNVFFNPTPYTTSNFIEGSFTVSAPLAADLVAETLTVKSFSFTDGHQTISSPTDSDVFTISTDSSGSIVVWDVLLQAPIGFMRTIGTVPNSTSPTVAPPTNDEATDGVDGSGTNVGAPGTWTETSPVPEPSTLALLASGALTLIAPIRRRLA